MNLPFYFFHLRLVAIVIANASDHFKQINEQKAAELAQKIAQFQLLFYVFIFHDYMYPGYWRSHSSAFS